MDNLAHTLFATALAKSRLGRLSPLSPIALVVAANFPDIDIVSGLWESPAYLLHHRGITHSLFGIVLQTVLLWAVFVRLEKWKAKRLPGEPAPSLYGPLPAVAIGLASHFFLDFLNTYGVRPWLPFSSERIYGDLVFIVDPYLWLLFAAGTFLPKPHARWGHAAFALFAMGTGWVALTHPRAPEFLRIVYPAGLACIGIARWSGQIRFASQKGIPAAFLAAGIYLGTLMQFRSNAQAEAEAALASQTGIASATTRIAMASPQPAAPWQWTFLAESAEELFWVPTGEDPNDALIRRAPRQLDLPEVHRARDTDIGRAWLYFARFPFASVEETENGSIVHLMDGRYQMRPPASWSGLSVVLDKNER